MDLIKELEKKQSIKYRNEGLKFISFWIVFLLIVVKVYGSWEKDQQSKLSASDFNSFNVEKKLSPKKLSKKIYYDDLNYICKTDKKKCINQWFDRIVKVEYEVNFMHVHSTGFILYSDKNYIYVISNSHSIRIGNGKDSLIHNISVNSDYFNINEKPVSACAFFQNFSDISIIKIPNVVNIIFDKPKFAKSVSLNEKLYVYTFKDEKLYFKPIVTSFSQRKDKYDFYMNMEALHGMSGSPVFSNKFELAGVLHSSSSFGAVATYNINFLNTNSIDDFIVEDNYNSKFICRTDF